MDNLMSLEEAETLPGAFVHPTGSGEAAGAVAEMWRKKQLRECVRLVRDKGWMYQADGSCIPGPDQARRLIHKQMRRQMRRSRGVHGLGDFEGTAPLLGAAVGYFYFGKKPAGALIGALVGYMLKG